MTSVIDQFAEINGSELRYRLYGGADAPLAVIGHGILSSLEQFSDQSAALDLLAERYRILLFDARGHGQSEGPRDADGYSWRVLGEDMLALAALAGEERPILGGASMSAAGALWAGLEYPHTPRALVLIIPPPLGPRALQSEDERAALRTLSTLAGAVESFGLTDTMQLARSLPGFGAAVAGEDRGDWLLSQNPRTIAPIIRGLFGAPAHDPSAYAAVRAPAIVFAHEGDPLHPIRSAWLLAERLPECRLHIGPEPNYWRDHPQELARELLAFLDEIGQLR